MRIVIQTLGSRGDVQPYVALGRALADRGHEVTVATASGFGGLVCGAGLRYHEIPIDVRALIASPQTRAAMRSAKGFLAAMRDAGGMIEMLLEETWASARDARAEAILYHPKMTGAPHVAERIGATAILSAVVPIVSPTAAYPSPVIPWGDRGASVNRLGHEAVLAASRMAFAGRVRRFRTRTLGLGRGPRTGLTHLAGRVIPRLVGVSRTLLGEPPKRLPGPSAFTGYWFEPPAEDWSPPPDLAAFLAAGPPPVYVGFGSMPSDAATAWADARAVAAAFAAEGRRGVLAAGWGGLATNAREGLGSHVHIIDGAPHSWLFPRCAAVFHHGGSGTTHEGLRWGRPTAIRPTFGDQPFWAGRVEAAGVGLRLRGRSGDGQVAEAEVRDALHHLDRPEMRAAAENLGAALRNEPGAKGAAETVERFASQAA